MGATVKKDEVRRILDDLPETATWDDLIYKIYVVECIEKGLDDFKEGRACSHEQVEKELGLAK